MIKKERAKLYAQLTSDDFEVRQAALSGLNASAVRQPTVISKTSFAAMLRKYRLQKRLTQANLAGMMETGLAHVNAWEIGNMTPSLSNGIKLCKLLGIPPAELFKCFPEVAK